MREKHSLPNWCLICSTVEPLISPAHPETRATDRLQLVLCNHFKSQHQLLERWSWKGGGHCYLLIAVHCQNGSSLHKGLCQVQGWWRGLRFDSGQRPALLFPLFACVVSLLDIQAVRPERASYSQKRAAQHSAFCWCSLVTLEPSFTFINLVRGENREKKRGVKERERAKKIGEERGRER